MIYGDFAIDELHRLNLMNSWFQHYALKGVEWLALLFLFYIGISILYYFGPAKKKYFRFFSAGSIFATVLTVLASAAFAFFINNFSQYNKLYGSIGAIIVILLWLYFNSFILLVGFELNASIGNTKLNKTKE